ncbi:unnamed protein product [Danaus chrysippus]|uniref:(African queen) hypothetical protein n=1 Tax=Danaus chrysippus TaxID=151541 RepID=A0A8J2WB66_9NEOP|nr:unnamed protein product [Danaus chrysippus]
MGRLCRNAACTKSHSWRQARRAGAALAIAGLVNVPNIRATKSPQPSVRRGVWRQTLNSLLASNVCSH